MGRFGLVELLITLALVVLLVGAHRIAGIFRILFRSLGGRRAPKGRAVANSVVASSVVASSVVVVEPDALEAASGGSAGQTTTESRNEAP